MTPDDLMAMHRATVKVLEDMAGLDYYPHGDIHLIDVQLGTLRGSVQALAVVQRDLLKGMLTR